MPEAFSFGAFTRRPGEPHSASYPTLGRLRTASSGWAAPLEASRRLTSRYVLVSACGWMESSAPAEMGRARRAGDLARAASAGALDFQQTTRDKLG